MSLPFVQVMTVYNCFIWCGWSSTTKYWFS